MPIADVKHNGPVDFEKEILPIFKRNCLSCHSGSAAENELVLETPQTIAKGGVSGPVVVPKDPAKSPLLASASQSDEPYMPPADNKVNAKRLTSEELGLIKLWIMEGATGTVSANSIPVVWQALPSGVNPIFAVAVSRDGQYAACGRANQIFIYHIPTGREIGRVTDPELLKGGVYKNPGVAHLDLVQSLAFSDDGLRLASGAYQEVKIWKQPTNVRAADFASAEGTSVVAVSPDRKWLAVGGAGNVIRIFDLAAGKEHKALTGHAGAITALRFTADNQKLVSGSADKSVRVWNVADGALAGRLDTPQPVAALTLVATGAQIATGGGDNLIRLWTTPAPAAAIANVPQPPTALAASPDKKLLAFGSADGKIVLVDSASGNVTRTLAGHGGPITSLTFSAANNRLISGSADKTIRVWDPNADQALLVLPAGLAPVDAVAIHQSGAQAASASGEGDIAIWKLDAAAPRKFNGDNGAPPAFAAVSPDGKYLAVPGMADGKHVALVYEIASGNIVRPLAGHEGPVTAIGFSGDSQKVVTGSGDKTARVWNLADGKELAKYAGHAQTVTAVALNSNGTQAASGAADNALKLWNAADGMELKNFAGHGGAIVAVAFTPDNAQVVSASADQTVRQWNPADGAQIRAIGLGAVATSLAVSRDNKFIAAGAADKSIKLYQVGDGAAVKTLAGHNNPVSSLTFSADNARLVSGSADNLAFVHDVASGKLLEIVPGPAGMTFAAYGPAANTVLVGAADKSIVFHTLRRELSPAGHNKKVVKLIYAADGNTLYSAGHDGLVLGFATNNAQAKFTANHTAQVNDLALSQSGQLLASAGENKEVRLWNAGNGQPHAKPQFAGFDQPVRSVAFTLDSARVAGGSAGGQVLVFSAASGLMEQAFLEHAASVDQLAATGEAAPSLVSSSADKSVRRWQTLLVREIPGHGGVVTALDTILNAPTQILSGSADQTVRTWETTNGQQTRTLNHGAPVTSVAVRPDAQQIAAAGGNLVRLWNAGNNQQVAEMKGDVRAQGLVAKLTMEKSAADNLAAAAKTAQDNGKKDAMAKDEAAKKAAEALAAAEKTLNEKKDALAKVKTERNGLEKALAEAKTKAAAATEAAAKAKTALDADANNEGLKKAKEEADKALAESNKVVGESDAKVKATDKPLADADKAVADATTPHMNAKRVSDQAAADSKRATDLVPTLDAGQKTTEAEQNRLKTALEESQKTATASETPLKVVAFSPDNLELAAGGDDKLVHTYSTANGQALAVFDQAQPVQAVAYVSERAIASGAADNHAVVWNTSPEWVLERTIAGGFVDRVIALDFNREGTLLATGGGEPSRSGEVKIFNVADGALVRELKDAHSDTVFGLEFSYDGKLLASCAADKFVKVFDVAEGKLQKSFEGHTHHVLGVSWMYDGKLLASCGADSVVKVWNYETGEQARTIQGFGKQLTSIRFVGISPEFVAACGDRNVHRRRANDGGNVRAYGGSGDFVYFADVTPDGNVVVAGGQDSVLRVWNGQNAQPLRTFEPPKPPEPAAPAQASK
ncbi:MAG: hypothetical protein HYS13_12445 [Planctomycetia bacterium]|nr:hypothetical protein [Planctomycetia bacterium]